MNKMNEAVNLKEDIYIYTITINKDIEDTSKGYNIIEDQGIKMEKVGRYLYTDASYSNYHTRKQSLSEQFLKALNKENITKDHLLNNVNTVYRFPGLTLSRDKLAILKEDCIFNVIRDRDKADVMIISEKTIEKMTSMTYRDQYNVKDVISVLKLYIMQFKDVDNRNHIQNLCTNLEMLNDQDIVTLEQNWYHDEDVTCPEYINFIALTEAIDKLSDDNAGRGYIHYINDNETYQYLVDNADKLVIDTHMNKLCVEDSVSFNKDDFERLEQLLKSNDSENINIALTLMANCNVEGSGTVLSLMFAFYSEQMKGAKVWNHVNFKYLRKIYESYINMTMSSWGNAYDSLIKAMCNNKFLNLWASRYIANAMFVNVLQNNCGAFTKESVFVTTVESLQLKDEYKSQVTNDEADISELINTVDVLPF